MIPASITIITLLLLWLIGRLLAEAAKALWSVLMTEDMMFILYRGNRCSEHIEDVPTNSGLLDCWVQAGLLSHVIYVEAVGIHSKHYHHPTNSGPE